MGIAKQYFNEQQYHDYITNMIRYFEDKYDVLFEQGELDDLMKFADAIYDECIPNKIITIEIPEDNKLLIEQVNAAVAHYDKQFNFLLTGLMMSEMANVQLRKRIKGGD